MPSLCKVGNAAEDRPPTAKVLLVVHHTAILISTFFLYFIETICTRVAPLSYGEEIKYYHTPQRKIFSHRFVFSA